MKVLFYSYPSAYQNPGGGEVQLDKTMEYLGKAGVEVKKFDQWNDRFEDYDILHIFGSVKDCLGLAHTAKGKGIKIALSTIFWSDFRRSLNESGSLKDRAMLIARQAVKSMMPTFPSERRELMMVSDILFPNGEGEAAQIQRYFRADKKKIFVVPNGVDERFKDASPEEFVKKHGLKDFIIYVGRIEPRKNQLNFIRAMKGSDKEVVFLGVPVSDFSEYYEQCREEAGANMHFIGRIEHDSTLLASAYAAAKVFALTSWFETPGLSALEAALAGANIVITNGGCAGEYFGDRAVYASPDNTRDIRRAIDKAYAKEKDDRLKRHILDNYTWDKVAKRTIEGYCRILKA